MNGVVKRVYELREMPKEVICKALPMPFYGFKCKDIQFLIIILNTQHYCVDYQLLCDTGNLLLFLKFQADVHRIPNHSEPVLQTGDI